MLTRIIFLLLGMLNFCACSSFYYHPIKPALVDRRKLPLSPQDVWFQAEDGLKLHGWYFSKSEKPRAVLLFFHGNAENLSTHFYSLYSAPDHGFDYFIFDYRGYGQSEGKPTPKGTIQDGAAALRWLNQKVNGKAPIIVFGQSLGGAIALRVAAKLKEEVNIKAVIVDSTFASYRSVARSVVSKHWLTWAFQPVAWSIVDNSESPQDDIARIAPIPLLVIHGDQDNVVDITQGEDVFKRALEPKEFWKIEGGRHTDFMFRENRRYQAEFYQRLDRIIAVQ